LKTIKLPYNTSPDNYPLISNIIREQTIIKKWSYNRFKDNKTEKEIRSLVPTLNNINIIDSWFVQSSIYDGKQVFLSNHNKKTRVNKKVIFNKYNFIRRQKGLINKDEYKQFCNNSEYIYSIGETPNKGNRKFSLELQNNLVIFKPSKGIKIELLLPNLRNNIKKELISLDLLSKLKKLPVTYKLDLKHIYITFDETVLNDNKSSIEFKPNRVVGIDVNPNHIGLSILEFNEDKYEIIKTYDYDLSKLTGKKDSQNKLKHETIEITNKIVNICKHYLVKSIIVENLSIKSKDGNKGRNYNSLVNNKWLRNLVQEQLEKRCNNYNVNFYKILPYYTSYIGNLQHDYFDPINASIEIARR
jgi:IS605 OrfB family transposase